MMGRTPGYPWSFRRSRSFNLLINTEFRVVFHTEQGSTFTAGRLGNPVTYETAGYALGGPFRLIQPNLTSYSDLVGTRYNLGNVQFHGGARMWRYYFVDDAYTWEVGIFPYWTGFHDLDQVGMTALSDFVLQPPAASDVAFYMLAIHKWGTAPAYGTMQAALWTANRLPAGCPPGKKANWIERQNTFVADGGPGGIILDSIEVVQTRRPSDPDEGVWSV